MRRHAPYTSEQALIDRLCLRRELSIIFIIYYINSIYDDLTQVFIDTVLFTAESISKEIILVHCCGISFCVKCLAK